MTAADTGPHIPNYDPEAWSASVRRWDAQVADRVAKAEQPLHEQLSAVVAAIAVYNEISTLKHTLGETPLLTGIRYRPPTDTHPWPRLEMAAYDLPDRSVWVTFEIGDPTTEPF